jgi:large subunit ribosomal protein L2
LSIVLGIFYDPARSVFISLCFNFLTKKFNHKLTTSKTYPGSLINSYSIVPEYKIGCIIPFYRTPTGSIINSIITNNSVKFIKSAGVYGILLQKNILNCKIKFPSGEIKIFSSHDHCVLGSLSNRLWNNQVIGKAGRSRLLGRRPHVRGVAMNPVDHPHGGNTSTGRLSVTPWAKPALGKPTKKIKKNVKI